MSLSSKSLRMSIDVLPEISDLSIAIIGLPPVDTKLLHLSAQMYVYGSYIDCRYIQLKKYIDNLYIFYYI